MHLRVFGKPFPRSALLRILQRGLLGHNLGFHATIAHVIHLSLLFVVTHRITADLSTIYRGSVTVTIQTLLRFFRHGLIAPVYPLAARELADCSAGRLLFLLLWTLAPRDYVTYYQARGLSGHTSPCGECVSSCFGATPGDWLTAQLVVYYVFYFGPWHHMTTPSIVRLGD